MEELAKKTVSYYCDDDISIHCLCGPNPMRPLRVKLTNKLVESYGLDKKMKMHRPRALSYEELNFFHADGADPTLRLPLVTSAASSRTHCSYFNVFCSRGAMFPQLQC